MPEAFVVALISIGFCDAELKPFGPVHEYDAPLIKPAISEMVFPLHKGLLLDAIGAGGRGLTITFVAEGALVQPLTVAVTLYTPEFRIPALLITGLEPDELNPLGPVQLYTVPATDEADRFKLVPWQSGELFEAAGDAGIGLIVTVVLVGTLVHCPTVTVTEYAPLFVSTTLLMTGSCNDD
jgi:hypothetical protein